MRNFEDLKMAVAGTGYVGLSIATLLAQHNEVVAIDVLPEKVDLINNKKSPKQAIFYCKFIILFVLSVCAQKEQKWKKIS